MFCGGIRDASQHGAAGDGAAILATVFGAEPSIGKIWASVQPWKGTERTCSKPEIAN
jgi:hypothetical protein